MKMLIGCFIFLVLPSNLFAQDIVAYKCVRADGSDFLRQSGCPTHSEITTHTWDNDRVDILLPVQQNALNKEQACAYAKQLEIRTKKKIKETRSGHSRRTLRNRLRENREAVSKYCY